MKPEDKELVGAFLALATAVVLFFFCIFWLASAVREELEPIAREGLKPAIERLWCGEDGCGDKS